MKRFLSAVLIFTLVFTIFSLCVEAGFTDVAPSSGGAPYAQGHSDSASPNELDLLSIDLLSSTRYLASFFSQRYPYPWRQPSNRTSAPTPRPTETPAPTPSSGPFSSDGTINNSYWGIIQSSSSAAASNTANFTKALTYAASNGIRSVKLQKGVYYVDGSHNNSPGMSTNGIKVPSNMDLDLNGSTLIQTTTSSMGYALILVSSQENISIHNGTLIGDKDTHIYSGKSTHEFGFGVDLRGAKNVKVYDLEIYKMTGDAIILGGDDNYLSKGGRLCENISIYNNKLHDCRRQGISIIGADSVDIYGNEIYNIKGTDPQTGIDLEAELDWPVKNVSIHNNKIYGAASCPILLHRGSENTTIYSNTLDGNIWIVYGIDTRIYDNTITNGGVYSTANSEPVGTIVENNTLSNSHIVFYINTGVVIRNNYLTNGTISLAFTNGAVYNNKIANTSSARQGYGIKIYADSTAGSNRYTVYVVNNSFEGSFSNKILFSYNIYCSMIEDQEKLSDYLAAFGAADISDTATPLSSLPLTTTLSSRYSDMTLIMIGIAILLVVFIGFYAFDAIRRRNSRDQSIQQ